MKQLRCVLGILPMMVACGEPLRLNVAIYDPCNQQTLQNADHIQFEIVSDHGEPQGTTWVAGEESGRLPRLDPVEDATVSAIARTSNSAGQPGEAIAAFGVGYLDLSGSNGQRNLDLSLAVGLVDGFMRTTEFTEHGTRCSSLFAQRRGHTATLLRDGNVFIVGGHLQDENVIEYWDTSETYSPRAGRFQRGPEMDGFTRRGHTATLLNDGRVLIVGGRGLTLDENDQPVPITWSVAQLFNPADQSVTTAGVMNHARAFHTATLLSNGQVLIVGGRIEDQDLQTTELYDPTSGTFMDGPVLHRPRSHHVAVPIAGNTVALLGGRGGGEVLSHAEFVQIGATSQVVDGPQMAQGRSHAAAALVEGQDAVIVAGGFGVLVDRADSGAPGLSSVEILRFDPADLSQSTFVCNDLTLSTPRGAPGFASVEGELLLVGGVGEQGTVLSTAERVGVERLDTCAVTFSATTTAMANARAEPQLTKMVSGDILVTGGFHRHEGRIRTVPAGEIYVRRR